MRTMEWNVKAGGYRQLKEQHVSIQNKSLYALPAIFQESIICKYCKIIWKNFEPSNTECHPHTITINITRRICPVCKTLYFFFPGLLFIF